VSELQRPRLATRAPSSTCESKRGSGVNSSRDRASAPAAPLLQGFWVSCAADHPHTRSEIKPRVCGWSAAHETQTGSRGAAGAQGETRRRDKWKKNNNKIKGTRTREAPEQREQQQQQHTAMGPVGQREEERDRGEQTRCGAAVAETVTAARGPQTATNERRHGRQNGRKLGVGEVRSNGERDCSGAVTAACVRTRPWISCAAIGCQPPSLHDS
jgi:hypothetical protein